MLNGVPGGFATGMERRAESARRLWDCGAIADSKWAEAVGGEAPTFYQTASAHGESAILHCVPVRKASRNFVQDDGRFFKASQHHIIGSGAEVERRA